MHREKWPWDFAREIIPLETREERVAALLKVPDKYREMTREHVTDYFSRKRLKETHKP